VLYLVFNEGYGPPVRVSLCAEAIRLARILARLMPDEPEAYGLTGAETDWPQIAALYAVLLAHQPSPVVELNRGAAVAMALGPEHGLELIGRIEGLERYHLFHSARADLLRRLERRGEARAAYERALELALGDVERRFLERRLGELETGGS
jgi:RNA polymerase sigma-70 factor (ECF subfamily)